MNQQKYWQTLITVELQAETVANTTKLIQNAQITAKSIFLNKFMRNHVFFNKLHKNNYFVKQL